MRYRLYCKTERKHVFINADAEPTTCPNDPKHEIVAKIAR
ncbi:unnamed protein product [marine sediment metagenome]|uniref:Uncharacterized protein n=1 Tax=marine sediment metagenome TaxID=412755 RepID=X1PU95_9ZZZZ